ncbi:MAG: hypothetical protein NC324_02505 [Bacteroides sp.]|nr:hypothetical protein [Bacteroides sp.]
MDNSGGALSFSMDVSDDKLKSFINDTIKGVQGATDAVVSLGGRFDDVTAKMTAQTEQQRNVVRSLESQLADLSKQIEAMGQGDARNELVDKFNNVSASLNVAKADLNEYEAQLQSLNQANSLSAASLEQVRDSIGTVNDACAINERELEKLEAEYNSIGKAMQIAFKAARDDDFFNLKRRQDAIKGEMAVRKSLIKDLREQGNELETLAGKIENERKKAENNANAQVSLRTQIRNLREEMANLRAQGIDENSEAYKRLVNELGRLQDIQGDIQRQGQIMSNDENQFQGVLSGLQGVVGGFTAAQGAVALFAGENENLQKVMLKVQSLMSITMGLQQVAQTLNKDSAFKLVTLNNLKKKWNELLAIGRGAQVAETAATVADKAAKDAETLSEQANTAAKAKNTVATGAASAAQAVQTKAAVAGTAANISLAGAFRMVGAAFKSIPGIGWFVALLGGLIAVISKFVKKANEGKKATEEFYKAVAENAYKPIASVEELAFKWAQLGDDFDAKKKFIQENKKAFEELGVAINGVTDAENLLGSQEQVQKFVDAQIKKAEAMYYIQQANDKIKTLAEKEQKYNNMEDGHSYSTVNLFGKKSVRTVENKDKTKLGEEIKKLKSDIKKSFADAAQATADGERILTDANVQAAGNIEQGTIAALESAISSVQDELKKLKIGSPEFKAKQDELKKLQDELNNANGKGTSSEPDSKKDAFLVKLEKYKAEYERFLSWVNSGDSKLAELANKEFAGLLDEGATYLDYLQKQRDKILAVDESQRTSEQNGQLTTLNNQIATESKETVLKSFSDELKQQMKEAKNVVEQLDIIARKREELSGDNTELGGMKMSVLDNMEGGVKEQMQGELQSMLNEYASFNEKRKQLEEAYNNDMAILVTARAQAQTDAERTAIDEAMANRKRQFESDYSTAGSPNYEALLAEYGSFEEKKQAIIDSYDAKRREAQAMGNDNMVKALDDAQAKAISSLATSELTGSEMWETLFNNMDDMAASKIEQLIAEIEAKFSNLSVNFNPSDLNSIKSQLESAKDVLVKDNPFMRLGQSIKSVFKTASNDSEDASDDIAKNWKKMGQATEDSFAFINDAINQCEPLKDILGDVGMTAIQSLQSVVVAAIGVATAVKTAEKSSVILAIIQAALVVVQAMFALFQLHDKNIQKQIEKHEKNVDRLKNAYTQLSWEVDRALGGSYYKKQQKAIENLRKQQEEIEKAKQLEASKKKIDEDKIDEYNEQQKELNRKIQDAIDEMAENIMGTDVASMADDLGDAIVDAFLKGEDAAKAWGDTVKDIVNQIVKNLIIQSVVTAPLEGIINKYTKKWFSADGTFAGFDVVAGDIDNLTGELTDLYPQIQELLEQLKEKLQLTAEEADTTLTGAVKGVSEETASLVAGQMNAIRINQLEVAAMLRNMLYTLDVIAANTAYNRHLANIDRVLSQTGSGGGYALTGSPRAFGISLAA